MYATLSPIVKSESADVYMFYAVMISQVTAIRTDRREGRETETRIE